MFCTKCGKKLPENTNVCSACGAPQTRVNAGARNEEDLGKTVLLPINQGRAQREEEGGTIRYIPPRPDNGSHGQTATLDPKAQQARRQQAQQAKWPHQQAAPRTPPAREKVKQIKQDQKKNHTMAILLGVLVAVLVIAAVVVGVFLFTGKSQGDKSKDTPAESKQDTAATADQDMKIQSQMEFNGHSYALFNVTEKVASTWDEAQAYCESLGGYLAIINSAEENDAIFKLVCEKDSGYAFFGYSDELSEGTWLWADGLTDSGYTNWGVDKDGKPEPNSASPNEDYAEFTADRTDGSWNDSTFGQDTYVFVCEWDGVANQ